MNFWVPYSGLATNGLLCRMTKCTGKPFPALLPLVNDLAECQPSKEVLGSSHVYPHA